MKKSRMISFDIARGLCVIWILFFHLKWNLDNTFSCIQTESYLLDDITTVVLATFTFISGFFNGCSEILSFRDVKKFWKKRWIRLYPLFFLSAVTLFAAARLNMADYYNGTWSQLILSLTGFSCIWGPAPKTLWYISMLIFLQALTPFFIINSMRLKYRIFICSCLGFVFIIMKMIGCPVDERFILNYLIYFAALFAVNTVKKFQDICAGHFSLLVLLSGFMGFCIIEYISLLISSPFWKIPATVSGMAVIVEIGCFLQKFSASNVFAHLSYISFTVYLFHRHFAGIFKVLFGALNIFEMICLLVVIFIGSWLIQKLYDKMISVLKVNHCMERTL